MEGRGSRALWEPGYSSAEEASFEAVGREGEPQRKRKGKGEEGGKRRRSRKKKENRKAGIFLWVLVPRVCQTNAVSFLSF